MDTRYDARASEQATQQVWEEQNCFHYAAPQDATRIFSIDTPPPTVSGNLHIGHVFSYTHTDMIARYKRLRGLSVFYPMGFDDNGLPTERFVEKKHKTKAHLHQRSDFIALCLKESEAVEHSFAQLWRTLGLSIDWSQTYSTISEKSRRIAQQSFLDLYEKKLVYRESEPALFCTTCRTTVAQAELEHAQQKTDFTTIAFTSDAGDILPIATTRPELLPACQAVFFHPDDHRYNSLTGQYAYSPYFKKRIPLIADNDVAPDKGSGLVMCCTFGDQQDIVWYRRHKLPLSIIINNTGTWHAETGPLAGMRATEARKTMLALLDEAGSMLSQEKISHAVQVHERCKQEIEYLVLKQWFIELLSHKEAFLARANQINWYPSYMKSRYEDWVRNLSWNWCISRQRFYGVPFPVWHCNNCQAILLARKEDLPIDPQETSYPYDSCPHCNSSDITGDTDVMDTWNISSLSPQINANWPEESSLSLPMSMRPQAHDIIRTWAFYTIIKAHYHQNVIPWKDIVISGHVLAGKSKISKSQGGGELTPESLLETYSADAIRFWSASSLLGTDTAFSEIQLKIGTRLLTKIWNAYRFMHETIASYTLESKRPELDVVNSWVCDAFEQTIAQYCKAFDRYEYHHALQAIEHFFWQVFCDNYLEIIKDQLHNPNAYSDTQLAATRYTLYEIGHGMLQLFMPFVPHITETIYAKLFASHEAYALLSTSVLDQARYEYNANDSAQRMKAILHVIDQVRKLKSQYQYSLKTPIELLSLYSTTKITTEVLENQKVLLAGITKADRIEVATGCAEGMSLVEKNNSIGQITVTVP